MGGRDQRRMGAGYGQTGRSRRSQQVCPNDCPAARNHSMPSIVNLTGFRGGAISGWPSFLSQCRFAHQCAVCFMACMDALWLAQLHCIGKFGRGHCRKLAGHFLVAIHSLVTQVTDVAWKSQKYSVASRSDSPENVNGCSAVAGFQYPKKNVRPIFDRAPSTFPDP